MNSELLKNKYLYKIFLTIIKYVPMVLSIIQIISTLLNYLGISTIALTCVGGTSLMFILLLFIMSYVFKFCYLYRIPLWYMFVMFIMSVLRALGILALDLEDLYRLYFIVSGFFMSLFIGYTYKNRNKPKRDYIKEFCNRYCN